MIRYLRLSLWTELRDGRWTQDVQLSGTSCLYPSS